MENFGRVALKHPGNPILLIYGEADQRDTA